MFRYRSWGSVDSTYMYLSWLKLIEGKSHLLAASYTLKQKVLRMSSFAISSQTKAPLAAYFVLLNEEATRLLKLAMAKLRNWMNERQVLVCQLYSVFHSNDKSFPVNP